MTNSVDGEEPKGHCQDILQSMYLFLDEEQLTVAQRAEVREHLDDCIPCLESFEFEAELKQVIKQKCTDEVPSSVYEKVRAKLSIEIEANQPKSADN